ncbi:MAG: C1 family peptidase [Propionicimonas sp.]|uniref:C1 family peptidase n=1 Tax=Propionicimonas sp. TaxID=1955623 RepID=UPI003D0D1329
MVLELSALRQVVRDEQLGWRPGATSHTGTSLLQARSRLGAVPPGGAAVLQLRERTAAAMVAEDAAGARAALAASPPPAAFDWRDVDGASYISAVRDQAGCGSCVAFGTTAVLESMVRIAAKEPALHVDLSEAYAFFCLGPKHGAGACPDGGWWPDDALTAMKSGITDEANFPYTDADQACGRGSDWRTRLTKYSSWTRKTTLTSMKRYLATVGPMTACFTIYEDFYYFYTGGVYSYHKKTAGDVVGGHCVQIVGYDDAQHCWIAKNSWGTGWGEDGYFRIHYGSAGIDAEMWGIDGTVTSPLMRTTLRVVASGAGNLWHTKRGGNGAWQKAVNRLDTAATSDPGSFTSVTAAATINRLHVVGLVGGTAWYSRQRTGAGWAKWARPTSTRPTGAGPWTALGCAAVGDTLHVTGLAAGAVWHTRRSASGTWQQAWVRATPANAGVTALSCVAMDGKPRLVTIVGGTLWLAGRKSNGTWSTPAAITPSDGVVPGAFTAVGAACVDGRLNVVALTGGAAWHIERSTAGAWGSFTRLGTATTLTAVSCADVGATLQVVGIANGKLRDISRSATGTWQADFDNLSVRLTGEPTTLGTVDCA